MAAGDHEGSDLPGIAGELVATALLVAVMFGAVAALTITPRARESISYMLFVPRTER